MCMLCTASANTVSISVQLSVSKKHIHMEKLAACSDASSVPFMLLVWKFALGGSPSLAQHKLCFVLKVVNKFFI